MRVEVAPQMLTWARQRSRLDHDKVARRFPKLADWEAGRVQPTMRQLQEFAQATHTPVGYLFLPEPPDEPLPIADFRTITNEELRQPSPDLLDTIYLCQQRQNWYRDFAISTQEAPLEFVGSTNTASDVVDVAAAMREEFGFSLEDRAQIPTWTEALRFLRQGTEDRGVLVMISGIVGSNTHRGLEPTEFRGFSLSDQLAPVVFVNGADTKAAQIFTLAHELGHLLLGESAVSNADPRLRAQNQSERWCNAFAAELLVPLESFRQQRSGDSDLSEDVKRLARVFKVSTLVILLRMKDAQWINQEEFQDAYEVELERVLNIDAGAGSGGNFYRTQPVRVSPRFARAVITSALEGQTLFRDAYRLLGIQKSSTFEELSHELGVA